VLAVAAGPFIYFESVAADARSIADDYSRLEKSGNDDPQDWFTLARDARDLDELELAGRALDKASGYGLPPVQVGIEKARILVASDEPGAATIELRNVFAAGFTSVAVLTNDTLINSMAGRKDYDELVAEMSVQAFPCAHQEAFRDFDFWVGEWDVHLADGTFAGSNVIKSTEKGCVLTENWSGASGGTGMSINYLDRASGKWVQVWNAAGGSQIVIRAAARSSSAAA
jgi:hypothetical protein